MEQVTPSDAWLIFPFIHLRMKSALINLFIRSVSAASCLPVTRIPVKRKTACFSIVKGVDWKRWLLRVSVRLTKTAVSTNGYALSKLKTCWVAQKFISIWRKWWLSFAVRLCWWQELPVVLAASFAGNWLRWTSRSWSCLIPPSHLCIMSAWNLRRIIPILILFLSLETSAWKNVSVWSSKLISLRSSFMPLLISMFR